jgi:hypothetical protein
MAVDAGRQFIVPTDDTDGKEEEKFIAIPIHTAKREFGLLLVKPRIIPDLKHNGLENLYGAAIENQAMIEKEIEEAIRRAGVQNSPRKKLAIQDQFSDRLAEAQASVIDAKAAYIKWAIETYDVSKVGPDIKVPKPSFKTAKFEGEAFQVLDDQTLIDLANCVKAAYGAKRAPIINNLFEILFDFQNGILTTAEDLYKRQEARHLKPAAESAEKGQEGAEAGQGRGKGRADQEGAVKVNPDPL